MMEPRELYGPEDIEQLLIERPFDELLEEERAFVLRHLSDRAEYMRMRALLLRMHEDDRPATDLDADPAVREQVLSTFRAQQKPQWRIWLNSVGGFLVPNEPTQFWKPALAFGTLALLVTVSVIGLRDMDMGRKAEMAEVRPSPGKASTAPSDTEEPVSPPPTEQATGADVQQQVAVEAAAATTTSADNAQDEEKSMEFLSDASVAEEPVASAREEATLDLKTEDRNAPAANGKLVAVVADSFHHFSTTGHTVNAAELTRNATMAEVASGTVVTASKRSASAKTKDLSASRGKAEQEGDDQGNVEVSAYLGLLRAAW